MGPYVYMYTCKIKTIPMNTLLNLIFKLKHFKVDNQYCNNFVQRSVVSINKTSDYFVCTSRLLSFYDIRNQFASLCVCDYVCVWDRVSESVCESVRVCTYVLTCVYIYVPGGGTPIYKGRGCSSGTFK